MSKYNYRHVSMGDEKLLSIEKDIKSGELERNSFVYSLVSTDLVNHQR